MANEETSPKREDGGDPEATLAPGLVVIPGEGASNGPRSSEPQKTSEAETKAAPGDGRVFLTFPDNVEQLVGPKDELPPTFRLSIIVPVFNEERSVADTVAQLLLLQMEEDFEICVINDGSTDRTEELLNGFSHPRLRVKNLPKNVGKGAAVCEGITYAKGTHILIFDADDEYRASDIPSLVKPIIDGRADVVYGVRRRGHNTMFPDFIHALGNTLMTLATNILYNVAMTDLHTCLKLIPVGILRDIELTEKGFGLDTQVTAEVLRRGFRPFEVPASYVGRTREQGKKIKAVDAVACFRILFMTRLKTQTSFAKRNRSFAPKVRVR